MLIDKKNILQLISLANPDQRMSLNNISKGW